MEEVCGARKSREREVSSGVEKQKCTSEIVHDESVATRSHDIRCQVGFSLIGYTWHMINCLQCIYQQW